MTFTSEKNEREIEPNYSSKIKSLTNSLPAKDIKVKEKEIVEFVADVQKDSTIKNLRDSEYIRNLTKPLFWNIKGSEEIVEEVKNSDTASKRKEEIQVSKLIKQVNIDRIFAEVLPIINERLKVQVCSLLLISKNNLLQIRCRSLLNEESKKLEISDWLLEEQHQPGHNFSGKAIATDESKKLFYGKAIIDNNLNREDYVSDYKKRYKDDLGGLYNGISVPIKGVHKPLGTIEVVNQLNNDLEPDESQEFNESDAFFLSKIADRIGDAVVRSRRIWENKVGIELDKIAADYRSFEDLKKACNILGTNLICEYTPYKVCIIRLKNNKTGSLDVVTRKGTDDICWENKEDSPRDKLGKGIVSEVYRTGDLIIIDDIENIKTAKYRLLSTKWFEDQKPELKSFVCHPLKAAGEVVGTISLFTAFEYKFSLSDVTFIESLCLKLASIKRIHDESRYQYVEYDEKSGEDKIYSIDDLFGLIVNNTIVLDIFDYTNEDIKEINKSFLVSILGQWAKDGNKKALFLLNHLIFKDYLPQQNISEQEFRAIKQAVRQIYSYYQYENKDRQEIIDFIKRVLFEGHRAAKFAACDLASYYIVEDFIKPLKDLINNSENDEELKEYASKQLSRLVFKIKSGQSAEDVDKVEERIRNNIHRWA